MLVIWATFYEQSLINQHEHDNELATQPIHSVQAIMDKPNANPNHIYTYENGSSDADGVHVQQAKIDKIHTTNIINGCTLELLPISAENNNGNLGSNNNRNIYRLNNNHKANNTNNNHNGSNCTPLRASADGTMAKDNEVIQSATNRNGSTVYGDGGGDGDGTKAIDSRIHDGLSKC